LCHRSIWLPKYLVIWPATKVL